MCVCVFNACSVNYEKIIHKEKQCGIFQIKKLLTDEQKPSSTY